MAWTTCGKRRNSAQLEGFSRSHWPSVVRSVHTLQIRFRTMASNSSDERSMLKSPLQTESKCTPESMPNVRLNYCVLQRLGPGFGWSGGSDACAVLAVGEIPLACEDP